MVREPYIPATESPSELTLRVVLIGIVLGAIMTAANAYLGLKVGLTVSASIPAAVMSMLILRGLRFEDVSILENNSVQTMASAGESLAAGIIFTVPSLLVLGIWTEVNVPLTFVIALLGGMLGTMFTIALRRLFIVEEALPYPEGVACREVLVAGEEGGGGLIAIVYALIIGGLYGWVVKGMHTTKELVQGAFPGEGGFLGTRFYAGMDLSLALLSVGYIVGLRIASFIFLGGVLGFGILVPIYGMINGWPVTDSVTAGFDAVWNQQIRYIGVGAMVVGGVWTLWSMRATIGEGLRKALRPPVQGGAQDVRTEIDLPMPRVLIATGVLVGLTFIFYWTQSGSLLMALAGALFLAVTAFFFAAVAGYIAGVVGSSNSPVSGMTIATLMFTILLVRLVGLIIGADDQMMMLSTMMIATIVATSAAIAGDVMQDLKTGHLVGATPYRQQIAEIIGVGVGAIAIGPVLRLLHEAFYITRTACEAVEGVGADACDGALLAPQAELIGAIVIGAFGGGFNYPMVALGVAIAVVLIVLKMPVMSVAIGIYLPLALSVPIMFGGIISHVIGQIARIRIDGPNPAPASAEASEQMEAVQSRGVLIGAGFIAGESLMGILVALLIVTMPSPPSEWLGASPLSEGLSLLFFLWFVLIFIWLTTRTLPGTGGPVWRDLLHMSRDSLIVLRNAVINGVGGFFDLLSGFRPSEEEDTSRTQS